MFCLVVRIRDLPCVLCSLQILLQPSNTEPLSRMRSQATPEQSQLTSCTVLYDSVEPGCIVHILEYHAIQPHGSMTCATSILMHNGLNAPASGSMIENAIVFVT